METVRIRQRGAKGFVGYYESLCALDDICPVARILAAAKEGVLNCHAYRMKRADWHPLLAAVQINRALHTIVFYDKWEERLYPAVRRIGKPTLQKGELHCSLRCSSPQQFFSNGKLAQRNFAIAAEISDIGVFFMDWQWFSFHHSSVGLVVYFFGTCQECDLCKVGMVFLGT